jgi:hypothetical protein
MLPHEGGHLAQARLALAALARIVNFVHVTHHSTENSAHAPRGGGMRKIGNGKRSAGSEASETPKTPTAQLSRGTVSLIEVRDFRAEAATASSRLKRRPFAAPCYFKRVFIQTAPLSKDGLLTVTPALRKAKAARKSKT